jgi:Uma2 family endonuclease
MIPAEGVNAMSTTAALPPQAMPTGLLSIEEFLDHYGDRPADLVEGNIVEYAMPGAKHGKICNRVAHRLNRAQGSTETGHVMTNDTHVKIRRNPDTARGMDVGFESFSRLPKESVPDGALEVVPELIFEVLSPSDRWSVVLGNVIDYLDLGVDVVVVLDPKTTSATVYRQQERPQTVESGETLQLPGLLPGFEVKVAELFD